MSYLIAGLKKAHRFSRKASENKLENCLQEDDFWMDLQELCVLEIEEH